MLEPALAAWWRHYDVHCLDRTRPFPGLPELLTRSGRRLVEQGHIARRGQALGQHAVDGAPQGGILHLAGYPAAVPVLEEGARDPFADLPLGQIQIRADLKSPGRAVRKTEGSPVALEIDGLNRSRVMLGCSHQFS